MSGFDNDDYCDDELEAFAEGFDDDDYCDDDRDYNPGWDDGECPEDDGQPTEYEEWQDYMGGDDWDHGQYDCDY